MIALSPADAAYPRGLRDLGKPPDPLWVDGDATTLEAVAVAIVGTRRMTGYGERVARELAMACAFAGVVVVSGLAQGVDSSAHRGAIDGGGRTVAVLGEGIGSFLATVRGRRRPLAPRIREHGALVSEYEGSFAPRPWMFAKRDATIAALAAVVVVVEAGEVSGALITAAHARRLGRRLYAVPGPLGSSASIGTNALIANGLAGALVSGDQLVRAAGLTGASGGPSAAVDDMVDALRDGPLGPDELASKLRLGAAEVSTRLARLALAGIVRTLPDGRIARTM